MTECFLFITVELTVYLLKLNFYGFINASMSSVGLTTTELILMVLVLLCNFGVCFRKFYDVCFLFGVMTISEMQ